MSRRKRVTDWTIVRVVGDPSLQVTLAALGDDDWIVHTIFREVSSEPGVNAYRVVAWKTIRQQQEAPRGKEGDAK